jgi:uncharacterized phage protein gp47/JayE
MPATPFTRETAADYAAGMIAWFLGLSPDTAGRVTDFNPGSNVRTLIEAVGIRLEHLDAKAWLALERAIPQVLFDFFGEGDGLTTTVGFPKRPALPASGVVRFLRGTGVSGDITIPSGTQLQVPAAGATPARRYVTTLPATLLAAGSFVDTMAAAVQGGAAGNVAANTLVLLEAITGVSSATNPSGWLNGSDAETDEARRQRFTRYLRNLARAQEGGLEVGALTATVLSAGQVVERVLAARAVTDPDQRGLVRVYVDNGSGTASAALVTAAQALIDGGRATDGARVPGYKAAGVVVEVAAVTPQIVPVAATIALDDGFDRTIVQPTVVTAIEGYLAALGVFADLILADLIATITLVRGVRDVAVRAPATNVRATTGARIVPGTITVTVA